MLPRWAGAEQNPCHAKCRGGAAPRTLPPRTPVPPWPSARPGGYQWAAAPQSAPAGQRQLCPARAGQQRCQVKHDPQHSPRQRRGHPPADLPGWLGDKILPGPGRPTAHSPQQIQTGLHIPQQGTRRRVQGCAHSSVAAKRGSTLFLAAAGRMLPRSGFPPVTSIYSIAAPPLFVPTPKRPFLSYAAPAQNSSVPRVLQQNRLQLHPAQSGFQRIRQLGKIRFQAAGLFELSSWPKGMK